VATTCRDHCQTGGPGDRAVYGREANRLAAVKHGDQELARLARHHELVAGLARELGLLVAGVTTAAVLAVAVVAHADGTLGRVLIVTVTLLVLAAFDASHPVPLWSCPSCGPHNNTARRTAVRQAASGGARISAVRSST
jgi:ABC-type transport system involved in cytochrome bd biosynthesis fused ATPase/permease subunit